MKSYRNNGTLTFKPPDVEWTKLFVGVGNDGSFSSSVVEVIDLYHSTDFANCSQPPEVEDATYGHPGTYFDGRAMLSFDAEGRNYQYYEPNEYLEWVWSNVTYTAEVARSTATAIMWDENTFWLTGGPDSKQTELLEAGVGFSQGPELPVEAYNHCMTKMGDEHVFMSGGIQSVSRTLSFTLLQC